MLPLFYTRHSLLPLVVCAATLVPLIPSATQAQSAARRQTVPRSVAAAPAPYTPFVRAVLANFDRWDLNHNGALSEKEIDTHVGSLETSGSGAAALAAIKIIVRGRNYDLPRLTRDYFIQYAEHRLKPSSPGHSPQLSSSSPSQATEGTEGVKTGNALDVRDDSDDEGPDLTPPDTDDDREKPRKKRGFPGYESLYRSSFSRIQRAPRVLYTSAGPRLSNIRQGLIGDCYLLAALGGLLHRDRDAFARMITQQRDGTCTVVFPNARTVTVQNLTDTEVALSSGTSGTGRWLAVLEEAYGNLRNESLTEKQQEDVSLDLITNGGSTSRCIRRLTGHTTSTVYFRKKVKGDWIPPTPEQAATRLPGLRERLVKNLSAGLLVSGCVGMYTRPPALSGNHIYTILAYDPAQDRITIWNPHGNTFTPKGTPGVAHGYRTRNGVFEMPLSEFVQVFVRVAFETDKLSTAAKTAQR